MEKNRIFYQDCDMIMILINREVFDMPIIRPVSDLRNKTPEIEEICIKEQKPVLSPRTATAI